MQYRNLGKSGLKVSCLGLGTWVTFGNQISDELAEEIVTLCYENGVNFFDTAEVYAGGRAEITLGKILSKKGWRRSSYIVSTKLFWGGRAETEHGLSRKHIIEGLLFSLERLQLDYVDIVFANKPDPSSPMEEIVRAFSHLVNIGKTHYWGTSRWSATEIMEAYCIARQFNLIPPTAEQAEYHMFHRLKVESLLPDLYHKIGLGTIGWSPLACGILTGKYRGGVPHLSRAAIKGYEWLNTKVTCDEGQKQQLKLNELEIIADKLNCTLSQLAIAWCLKNEAVSCILLGATNLEQMYDNLQAIKVAPQLTAHVMNEIDRILGNRPIQSKITTCPQP